MGHQECSHLKNLLSDYIDGDLDETLCVELEQHMAGCDNCRIVVDSLRKTVYIYKTATEQVPLPPEVRQRLFHCLDLDDFLSSEAEAQKPV